MNPILSLCFFYSALLLGAIVGMVTPVEVARADDAVSCKVAPLAKTPEDKVGDATPTFTWQALSGCTSYQLYLSNEDGILSITWVTTEEAGCTGGKGNCTFKPEATLAERNYGWWVRGWQPGEGTSKWSAGTRFSVDLDVCANKPQPVAPMDAVGAGMVVYQWLGVYGCEWYQLSASNRFGNVLSVWVKGDDIGCVYNSVCSYSPLETLPAGDYFWWIRGWSRGTQIGQWTSATAFSIGE